MKIYKIKVNGKSYRVEIEAIDEVASEKKIEEKKETKEVKEPVSASTGEGNKVTSPIQGTVINIKVKVGDRVKKGDSLLVIEAMKLENDVVSPFDGEVSEILVSKGQSVASKETVILIK